MLVQAVRLQTVRVQAIRLGTVYGQAFSPENNGTTADGRMSGASTDGVRTGGLAVPECDAGQSSGRSPEEQRVAAP